MVSEDRTAAYFMVREERTGAQRASGAEDESSLLAALDGQETVAWVLVNAETAWQFSAFWALVLAKVVDDLLLAAAKGNFLRVKVVSYTLGVRVLVSHN